MAPPRQHPVPLLLMADYWADPLWLRRSDGQADRSVLLESLALSEEMRTHLRVWAARYDALMQTDYEWPSDDEHRAWVEQGQSLLRPLRAELGRDYDVAYGEAP